MKIIFLLICFLVLFLIYVYAENKLMIIKKYSVENGTKSEKKLKIVQISDIHKKRCEKKIVSKVRGLKPDVIFLTGDVVSRSENNFAYMEYLIHSLSEICPVFACKGNHELDLPHEQYAVYKGIMEKYNVNFLDDRQIAFESDDFQLNIAGASLKPTVYKNNDGGYSNLEEYTINDMNCALGKKDGFTILLAHNPLCVNTYCEWGADVVFCGHIHGGIVRLPVLGGVLSPERRFFPEYSKGLYKIGKTHMIVSGGIGKLRIFNSPEIIECEIEI